MNSINLNSFTRLVRSSKPDAELVLDKAGSEVSVRVGRNFLGIAGKETVACNRSTLKAFREALSQEYGVFGEHAFDMALGDRLSEGKPLRMRDVRNVTGILDVHQTSASRRNLIESRFNDELNRQLETHPQIVSSGDDKLGEAVRRQIGGKHFRDLPRLKDQAELERHVSSLIDRALKEVGPSGARQEKKAPEAKNDDWVLDLSKMKFVVADTLQEVGMPPPEPEEAAEEAEEPEEPEVQPPAAKDEKPAKPDEDEIVGLRNLETQFKYADTSVEDRIRSGRMSSGMRVNSTGEKLVLERLKTFGVEPGFIAHRDWTAEQTKEMMKPGTLLDIQAKKVLRKLGHRWKGGVELGRLKNEHFGEIRDAIIKMSDDFGDGVQSSALKLRDRFIVKLDYNKGDVYHGKFAQPSRVFADAQCETFGKLGAGISYLNHLTTPDKVSCDAVREALANDLTRAMGVPAQELELARTENSQGGTRFMLKIKMAKGYKDLGEDHIRDGRISKPLKEDIGKYKTAFLLLADRDAVGKTGKNKGVVDGNFFAIDPGHALEGNGKDLVVRDDFSYTDKNASPFRARFDNFTIFDDSNRSEKLKGWMKILASNGGGASGVAGRFKKIFDKYEQTFAGAKDLSQADRNLYAKIGQAIAAMKAEFTANFEKMAKTFAPLVRVYQDVARSAGEAQAAQVIDAIENFERATSPVRTESANGEVKLKHLEVVPETRTRWEASVDGEGAVTFSTSARLTIRQVENINDIFQLSGLRLVNDRQGGSFLKVPQDKLGQFLETFTEDRIGNPVGGR